ncbi:ParD-like family protein [Endozoicomonas sp. 4G]|uniref:ParD-like family protein n=1 Tax=Endozoicomonas sp. 4G TaxID=2872754 RepID=UPI002078C5F6|nr:ParD-like family protein [Endozoicomonas sp. 4G]
MASAPLRLNEELVRKAAIVGSAMSRTPPKQIEHWAKIGKILEENPDLTYSFVERILIAKAEMDSGEVVDYDFMDDQQ